MIVRVRIPRSAYVAAIGLTFGLLVMTLLVVVPRWFGPSLVMTTAQPPPVAARKIKAKLFYVAADGMKLAPIDRDVPFGEGPAEQAKRIVEAQLAPPPADAVSAMPPGTSLRALYLLSGGQAYVDLSREASTAHSGGTLNEILTVYTIVEALTTNLPAITSVHLLVDGREVETLAGHVDLRRPLRPNPMWVTHDTR
jgi:spore germination protein GerM